MQTSKLIQVCVNSNLSLKFELTKVKGEPVLVMRHHEYMLVDNPFEPPIKDGVKAIVDKLEQLLNHMEDGEAISVWAEYSEHHDMAFSTVELFLDGYPHVKNIANSSENTLEQTLTKAVEQASMMNISNTKYSSDSHKLAQELEQLLTQGGKMELDEYYIPEGSDLTLSKVDSTLVGNVIYLIAYRGYSRLTIIAEGNTLNFVDSQSGRTLASAEYLNDGSYQYSVLNSANEFIKIPESKTSMYKFHGLLSHADLNSLK